ncbi:MAG: SRPBCC family protein [Phycisphaerales bacterium]|jgi:carbon monoxide dehydrogenase subunit G|nr:SRPBCC family protein [Phycisphaerales bacterium]
MASLALTIERRIAAPQQAVWDIITDIPGSIDRIDAIVKIEMLTDQGMGMGTRWKETRLVFKRESTEEMQVIEFEPPLRYVVEAHSCGAHFVSELRCEPDGEDGSRLVMTMETTPVTFFAKLMKPLAKLAMGTTRKILVKDLDDIAKACTIDESDPPSEETGKSCQP